MLQQATAAPPLYQISIWLTWTARVSQLSIILHQGQENLRPIVGENYNPLQGNIKYIKNCSAVFRFCDIFMVIRILTLRSHLRTRYFLVFLWKMSELGIGTGRYILLGRLALRTMLYASIKNSGSWPDWTKSHRYWSERIQNNGLIYACMPVAHKLLWHYPLAQFMDRKLGMSLIRSCKR